MTKTNSIGPDKVQMSTAVPSWLDAEIKKLADQSGLSRNKYVIALLRDAVQKKVAVKETTTTTLEVTPQKGKK